MNTADSFKSGEGALLRSRLHIRAGKRRLRQAKISAGIATLYDALIFGLDYYISVPEHKSRLKILQDEDIHDDRTAYNILLRSNAIRGDFDYDAFNSLVETALNGEMPDFDYGEMLKSFESLMTQLKVMPFDEASLPAEDPATF